MDKDGNQQYDPEFDKRLYNVEFTNLNFTKGVLKAEGTPYRKQLCSYVDMPDLTWLKLDRARCVMYNDFKFHGRMNEDESHIF